MARKGKGRGRGGGGGGGSSSRGGGNNGGLRSNQGGQGQSMSRLRDYQGTSSNRGHSQQTRRGHGNSLWGSSGRGFNNDNSRQSSTYGHRQDHERKYNNNRYPQNPNSSGKSTVEELVKDLTTECPLWPFTSYGLDSHRIDNFDWSPEESRWMFQSAGQQAFQAEVGARLNSMIQSRSSLLANLRRSNQPRSKFPGWNAPIAGSNGFGASAGTPFAQSAGFHSQSPFGQSSQQGRTPFGGSASTNTSSNFAGNSGPFGNPSSGAVSNTPFGVAANAGTAMGTSNPQSSFRSPGFGSAGTFGANGANPQSNPFAAVAQPTNNPFGNTSQQHVQGTAGGLTSMSANNMQTQAFGGSVTSNPSGAVPGSASVFGNTMNGSQEMHASSGGAPGGETAVVSSASGAPNRAKDACADDHREMDETALKELQEFRAAEFTPGHIPLSAPDQQLCV